MFRLNTNRAFFLNALLRPASQCTKKSVLVCTPCKFNQQRRALHNFWDEPEPPKAPENIPSKFQLLPHQVFPTLNIRMEGIQKEILDQYAEFIHRAAGEFEIDCTGVNIMKPLKKIITIHKSPFVFSKQRSRFVHFNFKAQMTLFNCSPETKKVYVNFIAHHCPPGIFLVLTDMEYLSEEQIISMGGGKEACNFFGENVGKSMLETAKKAADVTMDRYPVSNQVKAVYELKEKRGITLREAMEEAKKLGILAGDMEHSYPPRLGKEAYVKGTVPTFENEEEPTFESRATVLKRIQGNN